MCFCRVGTLRQPHLVLQLAMGSTATSEETRPLRKLKTTRRGCCAAKPAREESRPVVALPHEQHSSGNLSTATESISQMQVSATGRAAAVDTSRRDERATQLAIPASTKSQGSSVATLSPAASNELRKDWAIGCPVSVVLSSARVTGSERLQTDETRWIGASRTTAMYYRIEGTVRQSDGSERPFRSMCRYSLLHELHMRMSHDRLGAQSMEERQQLHAGLALFPQKKWIGGDSVVASREEQISQWLGYWSRLSQRIEHTRNTVEAHNSALARCSALICEYLSQDTDHIGSHLHTRKNSAHEEINYVVPRSAFRPKTQHHRRSVAKASSISKDEGDGRDLANHTAGSGSRLPANIEVGTALCVHIVGIRSPVGAIRIVLWNNSRAWLNDDGRCLHSRYALCTSDIASGTFDLMLPPLPVIGEFGEPLEYAMMAIHDIKDTGKLDTNATGIPYDGICCSNGATGGPGGGPKWDVAKFLLVSITRDMFVCYPFLLRCFVHGMCWYHTVDEYGGIVEYAVHIQADHPGRDYHTSTELTFPLARRTTSISLTIILAVLFC